MIELIRTHGLEYSGIITALLGVFYSIKQQKIAWIWNFIASCIYGILFYQVGLYSDMELQGIFMAMAIYGFIQWNQPSQWLEVTTSSGTNLIIGIGGSILFGVVSGYLHRELTNASLPFLDATLTGLSIWATYLAAKMKIENWLVWILVNIIYVGIYFYKEMHETAILYIIFLIFAFRGFYTWKKKLS
jgi:nicotinamide mononucleotide transporter